MKKIIHGPKPRTQAQKPAGTPDRAKPGVNRWLPKSKIGGGVRLAVTKPVTTVEPFYQPKTELGRKLWTIRQEILASGEPLKTPGEINEDLEEQRHAHYYSE